MKQISAGNVSGSPVATKAFISEKQAPDGRLYNYFIHRGFTGEYDRGSPGVAGGLPRNRCGPPEVTPAFTGSQR